MAGQVENVVILGSGYVFCLSQMVTLFPGALTCSMANCQYGCDVVKGQIRCQCPSPGLQLAPDGRTCVGELQNQASLSAASVG